MWPNVWKQIKRCAGGAMLLLAAVPALPAGAQETIEQRLDRLEKQNQVLQQQNLKLLDTIKNSPVSTPAPTISRDEVKAIVEEHLTQTQPKAADAAKKDDAGDGFYRIGSDLRMSASWKNGVVISTTNGENTLHIGGWLQDDWVWWDQSTALRTAKGANAGAAQKVLSGNSLGGINDLQDGTYFRRIRIMMDGKFWENFEYTLVWAFENDQFLTIGLDEMWVGATNIPLLGTVRIGHVKGAHGLEADMSGSSRTMTFLERSSYSEAIEGNENFMTGLWLGNNYFDQRATWSASIGRGDAGFSTGANFGDGQYTYLGRLTALPLYECEGRQLMHVGVSGGWDKAQNNLGNPPVPGPLNFHTIQMRSRPELRDDVPAGGFANGNSNRMIDTGVIACDSRWSFGTEFLYIRGPFSLQAEYGWAWLENVQGQFVGGKLAPAVTGPPPNVMFNGGYVQLAYTLTGENRAYDKRLGRLNSNYFGANGPFTNAWFVRDDSGALNWGLGAWEVAARASYTDLNGGNFVNRIQGGKMDGITLGLNWYLNANLKVQFDYVFDHRYALPVGSFSGDTHGFGTRVQFMW